MKFCLLLLLGMLTSLAFAQESQRQTLPNLFPTEPRDIEDTRVTWDDFYQQNGMAQFNVGNEFAGSSIAYYRGGSGHLIYGFNVDILSVGTTPPPIQNFHAPTINQTGMLIPFWFTLKMRLSQNPNNTLSPYLITGAGPTLGMRIKDNSSFVNALSSIDSELGAGGFVGAGVDYLWAGSWAISMDVRYNVIRFANATGLSDAYDGVSFSIGFIRAFGL